MRYFDAHAHYLSKQFNKDRHQLLLDIHRSGVEYIVDSVGVMDMEKGLQLVQKYDFVYLCIGDYGSWEASPGESVEAEIERYITKMVGLCESNKKIVALGEMGLDMRRGQTMQSLENDYSIYWFKRLLEAAREVKLPVVIHSGDACQPVFDILYKADMPDYGHGKGIIHCYLGTPKMAMDYIQMGYLISISGIVTHKSARGKNLVEVVKTVPLKHMVIETDCPYLTPEPFRSKRNDSGYLKYVINEIAKLKNISPEEVAKTTLSNAKALYRIK
ncbi:MAG: TatD family hydrolase [Defluviitaleaceae bacterium]|nr:TatD family hydrolase [Defluviitaleaceae bacterium]